MIYLGTLNCSHAYSIGLVTGIVLETIRKLTGKQHMKFWEYSYIEILYGIYNQVSKVMTNQFKYNQME